MTKQTRMFMHSNGVRHKYKLQSGTFSKRVAQGIKKMWKSRHYYVRIVETEHFGKTVWEIYTFRADK